MPAMPLLTTGRQWVGGDKIERPVYNLSVVTPKILNEIRKKMEKTNN